MKTRWSRRTLRTPAQISATAERLKARTGVTWQVEIGRDYVAFKPVFDVESALTVKGSLERFAQAVEPYLPVDVFEAATLWRVSPKVANCIGCALAENSSFIIRNGRLDRR